MDTCKMTWHEAIAWKPQNFHGLFMSQALQHKLKISPQYEKHFPDISTI